DARDLRANLLDGDVEALEDAGRKTLLLAQQAEQDVLGADVVVLERTGLVLSENDHLACPLGEPLEHEGHIVARGTAVPSPLGMVSAKLLPVSYLCPHSAEKKTTPRTKT